MSYQENGDREEYVCRKIILRHMKNDGKIQEVKKGQMDFLANTVASHLLGSIRENIFY